MFRETWRNKKAREQIQMLDSLRVSALCECMGSGLGLKMRKFPSVNKPGLGERHTNQIHTSLSDKMFIDNFSSAEELIDTSFLLEKHLKLMEKKNSTTKSKHGIQTFVRKWVAEAEHLRKMSDNMVMFMNNCLVISKFLSRLLNVKTIKIRDLQHG